MLPLGHTSRVGFAARNPGIILIQSVAEVQTPQSILQEPFPEWEDHKASRTTVVL